MCLSSSDFYFCGQKRKIDMKRTTNYDLPTWEKDDFIRMQDFNDLTGKLDAALKSGADATAEKADGTATQQALSSLQSSIGTTGENCRIVYGSYVGDGRVGEDKPVTLSFDFYPAAVLVTVSPQARADITRWVAEQTGNVLDFQFRGDSPAQPIPQYQITALPEGYVETERTDSFAAGNVTYKNSDGDMILLSYTYMHDGAHDGFILDNTDTVSDIRVSGMPGKLILSSLEDHDSYVTWIDGASNMQFTVSAAIDEVSIIAIAESVSLCNSTK